MISVYTPRVILAKEARFSSPGFRAAIIFPRFSFALRTTD